jgi:sporulation protein YlmC with PRC-barrel domain
MPCNAASDVPAPLAKLSALVGREVNNLHGDKLGEIAEIVIDTSAGDVAYAVIAFETSLGGNDRWFAMPWRALQPAAEDGTFRLAVDETQLKDAPSFDKNQWPDMEDQHWGDTIHAYYGQSSDWGQRLPPAPAQETPYPAEQRFLRTSQVLRSEVMNTDGHKLGDLEEVVIDTATGDIVYSVLAFGGFLGVDEKWFAIPWRALRPAAGFRMYTLAVDKEVLEAAAGFDKGQWPKTANPRWSSP